MAVFAAPSLLMTAFSKRAVSIGQEGIVHRVTGKVSTISRGPFLWAGRCEWRIQDSAALSDAHVFSGNMLGQENQARIYLPRRYAPQNTLPQAASATLSASKLTNSGELQITLRLRGGRWTGVKGDHINISGRLYIITYSDGSNRYRVEPNHVPPRTGVNVEINRPFVIASPTSPDQMAAGLRGWKFSPFLFDWLEYPLNT